jgi:hypothetical protein
MPEMKISYSAEQRDQAKAEKLHLVTLDINGKHAKRDGVTYQGFLFNDAEVQKVWEFFEWLASKRHKEQK